VNDAEIRDVVFRALSRVAPEASPATLVPGDPLRDQVDIDSMDFLNFVVALHERLGVDIPEADYAKLGTIDAIVGYLATRLAAKAASALPGA